MIPAPEICPDSNGAAFGQVTAKDADFVMNAPYTLVSTNGLYRLAVQEDVSVISREVSFFSNDCYIGGYHTFKAC